MSLEKYFQIEMENLRNKINQFKNSSPELIRSLSLDHRDPHVDRLIGSIALISGSIQQRIDQKVHKEIKSLLFNLLPEEFIPPIASGIIQVTNCKKVMIPKGRVIRTESNIFRTKHNAFLTDSEILTSKPIKKDGRPFLELTIKLKQKVERLQIYANSTLINSIFTNESTVNASVQNRETYETKCQCLSKDPDLKQLRQFYNEFCFFSLENLDLSGVSDLLTVLIPLQSEISVESALCKLNCIAVENSFYTRTAPFIVDHSGDYELKTEGNKKILQVYQVFLGQDLACHVSCNERGWTVLAGDEIESIYLNFPVPLHKKTQDSHLCTVEILCTNTDLDLKNPIFEEFIEGSVRWEHLPYQPRKENRETISLLCSLLMDKRADFETQIPKVLSLYGLNNLIDKIEVLDEIRPVKNLKTESKTIAQLGKLVTAYTLSEDFLLIRALLNEFKKYENVELSLKTPKGLMLFK